jgi:hypothetical protein
MQLQILLDVSFAFQAVCQINEILCMVHYTGESQERQHAFILLSTQRAGAALRGSYGGLKPPVGDSQPPVGELCSFCRGLSTC